MITAASYSIVGVFALATGLYAAGGAYKLAAATALLGVVNWLLLR